jgi:hypothetical protein
MAKAARNESAELPIAGSISTTLTYLPDDGDPVINKWCGITFRANVPVELIANPQGTKREQLNAWMIENAKGSRFYSIGDAPHPRVRKPNSEPETAEEYRAYMVEWLKQPFDHASDLIARFVRDRDLQTACEVGFDDYQYLATLFMPKLHELARGDELSEQQVAQLWLSHGVNQLPW